MTAEKPELFPIVGIGASAGGLEALEEFFRALPPGSGLAFVVVTHLPPERESSLVAILGQYTAMPVIAIEDGVKVVPDTVHVLTREGILTIAHGALHLRKPDPL